MKKNIFEDICKDSLRRRKAPSVPDGADAVYLYSPTEGREHPREIDPCFRAQPNGANIAFTAKIPFGPDLIEKLSEWEEHYLDGVVIGYHTLATQEIYFL